MRVSFFLAVIIVLPLTACSGGPEAHPQGSNGSVTEAVSDVLAGVQARAVATGHSPYLHWGGDPAVYAGYDSHSNRFVPVYVLGNADLSRYSGANSPYRDANALRDIYGYLPDNTLNPDAVYLDQTNVFDLQEDALEAGVEHIFLVVFDGMDYTLLRLAMLAREGEWTEAGPGNVFSFQTHRPPGHWAFGFAVTSPYGEQPEFDLTAQTIGQVFATGGYDAERAGATPWDKGQATYLTGRDGHTVTDSAASAVAMTIGEKTYNGSINIGPDGDQSTTIAHLAQNRGYAVGTVTSVVFPHATPAAAYAHNVDRTDYVNIARDMLGLPSVSHPDQPLPGLDVVMGAGYGLERTASVDFDPIDVAQGGAYVVAQRTSGMHGSEVLRRAVDKALSNDARLFAWFGTRYGHLPYATANGDHEPVASAGGVAEQYTEADLVENPTLTEMTHAAMEVLSQDPNGFWLMVEAGDVDWAAHANNIDNMAGAIFSGDAAVQAIIQWVETHSNWRESLLIVTADHGHLLYVDDPAGLAGVLSGSMAQ